MKKAYDSVSTSQLTKAMERIHIHPNYIKLINNIQNQRTNSVNTRFGNTSGYQVLDGLDQGETNAPIHWRIFYDPLLAEIKRQRRKLGFELHTKWRDPITKRPRAITNHFAGCAFVDDTLWCSTSRNNMQRILNIATEFYEINDININSQKTTSIVLNDKKTTNHLLKIKGETIRDLEPGESERYLEIYLSTQGIKAATIKVLNQEVTNTLNKIRNKAITDKQAHYIIHHVLFPIIEYRSQATYLAPTTTKQWDTRIRNALRRKARLSKDHPIECLHHPGLYNLKFTRDL